MTGQGRGYQLLDYATSGEVNNSITSEEVITNEKNSEIVTNPYLTWRRDRHRRMEEGMEEQRNARRHQIDVPDTPRSPSPDPMEEQEHHFQPPRIIPMAPGSPPPPDHYGRHLPPSYDSLYGPPTTRRLPDFLQENQQVQHELAELAEQLLETQTRLMAAYQQERHRILRRFYE